jgi:hypothetical protein
MSSGASASPGRTTNSSSCPPSSPSHEASSSFAEETPPAAVPSETPRDALLARREALRARPDPPDAESSRCDRARAASTAGGGAAPASNLRVEIVGG